MKDEQTVDGLEIDEYGDKWWWKNGGLHRDDGPAVEFTDGYKAWYQNDEMHREDGPAVVDANGHKEWFLRGKQLTEEEHRIQVDSLEFDNMITDMCSEVTV